MTTSGWPFDDHIAIAYGATVVWWLGATMFGIAADCGLQDVDGQCGMSMAFMVIMGTLGAISLMGIARGLGIPPRFWARDQRRFWDAGASAVLAGLIALDAAVLVEMFVVSSHGALDTLAFGLPVLVPIAFVGAPFAFAMVFVVVLACDEQLRRSGRATVWWACGAGVLAGAVLGFVVPLNFLLAMRDRAWMVTRGAWMGGVAGWVFWHQALRPTRLRLSTEQR